MSVSHDVGGRGLRDYSGPGRSRNMKKLRLHILSVHIKGAKKLRLSQGQAKKLVKKLKKAFSEVPGP